MISYLSASILARVGGTPGRVIRTLLGDADRRSNDHNFEMYEHFLSVVLPLLYPFDYGGLKSRVMQFVESMRTGREVFLYKYADSTRVPTIYCSTYACMLKSLYGELGSITARERLDWLDYFGGFQSADDGLFRDPAIDNDLFESADWWGARHLAVQVISCFTALGGKTVHDFRFLEPFYSPSYMRQWLEGREWHDKVDYVGNEIMNYGCLLQYSRDAFGNRRAGEALEVLKKWLLEHIDPGTGMWWRGSLDTPAQRSQAVQGAYHIFPLFFYDRDDIPYKERFLDNLLLTQNRLGGFGVLLNSSACEDIDTVEPLFRLCRISDYRRDDVYRSLRMALPWVLSNLNKDGGFVFRRNNEFVYGHKEMSSGYNESSLFATWFRSLCLAYLSKALKIDNGFHLNRCPGYEFD